MKKLNKKQKIIVFIAILLIAVIVAIVITTNIVSNDGIMSEGYAATANASSTLVANYIKKGITIGGITGTLESLNTFDATATPEDVAWGKTCYVKGEKITGTRRTLDMLEIGDYIDYTPDTASSYYLSSTYSGFSSDQTISQITNIKWKIMSINNDGTVDITTESPVNSRVTLRGATGYNNGVYILNDIGRQLYSNSSLNAVGRSINLEDIEKHYNDAGKKYRDDYVSADGVKYGDTKTYNSEYGYYPSLYAQEIGSGINSTSTKNDGLNKSDSSELTTEEYNNANTLTVTQTFYRVPGSNEYYNDNFYDVIGEIGWIATRVVDCYVNGSDHAAAFSFATISIPISNMAYFSKNSRVQISSYLRPVVTLPSSIKVTGGEGTSSSPYQISK